MDLLSVLFPLFKEEIPLSVWDKCLGEWEKVFRQSEPDMWKTIRRINQIAWDIVEWEGEFGVLTVAPRPLYGLTCGIDSLTSSKDWTTTMKEDLKGFRTTFSSTVIEELVRILIQLKKAYIENKFI
jgi:hypothetical protein